MKHIILSGGVGSRLWPLSRKEKPKQYLNLFQGKSLFELSIERNKNLAQKFLVVCNQAHQRLCQDIMGDFPLSFVVESVARNTAAAIAFAAFSCSEEEVMLITPSDHLIGSPDKYKKAILEAKTLAEQGFLVTFGIQPTRPETGYGYIKHQENDVLSFVEKPNLETAKDYIKSGNYLWNSGMFCFKAGIFLEELKKSAPAIYAQSKKTFEQSTLPVMNAKLSAEIPSESIDYAVMETSDKVKVVPSDFDWTDLGSFESLYDYLKDNGTNVDSNGNMVIGSDKYVAFAGLNNVILVEQEDAVLVLQKEKAQEVKQVYTQLEKNHSKLI